MCTGFSKAVPPHVVITKASAKVFHSNNLFFDRQTVSCRFYFGTCRPIPEGVVVRGVQMVVMAPSFVCLSTLLPQRKGLQ